MSDEGPTPWPRRSRAKEPTAWSSYVYPRHRLQRLIDQGWTDEEIVDLARQGAGFHLHAERQLRGDIVTVRGKAPRSKGTADPAGKFWRAVQSLRERDGTLSRTAVATEMGIDRGTLSAYIAEGLVPTPPWEGLKIPQ